MLIKARSKTKTQKQMARSVLKTNHEYKNSFHEKRLVFSNPLSTLKELALEPDPKPIADMMFDDETTKKFADLVKGEASKEYQPVSSAKELIRSVKAGVRETLSETRGIGVDVLRSAIGEKSLWDTVGRALEGGKRLGVGTIKSAIRSAAIIASTPFAIGRLAVAATAGIGSRLILTTQEIAQMAVGAPSRPLSTIEEKTTSAVEKITDTPSNIIKGTFGKTRKVLDGWSGLTSEPTSVPTKKEEPLQKAA